MSLTIKNVSNSKVTLTKIEDNKKVDFDVDISQFPQNVHRGDKVCYNKRKKTYLLNLPLPNSAVKMKVEKIFDDYVVVACTYSCGHIYNMTLKKKEFGERKVCENDYLEMRYDGKLYTDRILTYEMSKK